MLSELILTTSQRDQIVDHALEGYPNEVVGLLGGSGDGRVKKISPLKNLLGSRYFLADPYEQYQALRAFKTAGLSPLAVYHSHPDGGATLSQADLHFAQRLSLIQVIVALTSEGLREIRAHRVEAGKPLPIPLVVLAPDGKNQ